MCCSWLTSPVAKRFPANQVPSPTFPCQRENCRHLFVSSSAPCMTKSETDSLYVPQHHLTSTTTLFTATCASLKSCFVDPWTVREPGVTCKTITEDNRRLRTQRTMPYDPPRSTRAFLTNARPVRTVVSTVLWQISTYTCQVGIIGTCFYQMIYMCISVRLRELQRLSRW